MGEARGERGETWGGGAARRRGRSCQWVAHLSSMSLGQVSTVPRDPTRRLTGRYAVRLTAPSTVSRGEEADHEAPVDGDQKRALPAPRASVTDHEADKRRGRAHGDQLD